MFPVLPSFRPYRDEGNRNGCRATELSSFRDDGENGGADSTELWPLTGLYATGTDLHRRVQRGGMFHRRNSPVRRNDHDGCLVPKGHKLGRDGAFGRPTYAPSGAKPHRLPQLSRSRFRKLMASLRCPISMFGLPSRSAMVRATLRMRS